MTETRARIADPTLSALGKEYVVVTTGDRPSAHQAGVSHEHMKFYGFVELRAEHACWFAVPCRDCFPDAPPPGNVDQRYAPGNGPPFVFDPDLAWQTAGHDDQDESDTNCTRCGRPEDEHYGQVFCP